METSFLTSDTFVIASHALASASAFLATLILSNAVRANQGAKANRAWVSVALGLILIGIAEGSKLMFLLGLPLIESWEGALQSFGVVLILLGAFVWGRIVKKANS